MSKRGIPRHTKLGHGEARPARFFRESVREADEGKPQTGADARERADACLADGHTPAETQRHISKDMNPFFTNRRVKRWERFINNGKEPGAGACRG